MAKQGKRFVFDTNVLISALLMEKSKPAKAMRIALEQGEILLSEPVFQELRQVLSREKFNRYILWDERQRFLAGLLLRTILVEIVERVSACRDTSDNQILELAVNGEATCIISGDTDLLALHPFRDIPILTPEQFLTIIEK